MEVSKINYSCISQGYIPLQNSLYSKIPEGIFEFLLTFFDGEILRSAALVDKFWNQRIVIVFQKKDLALMNIIARNLANSLSNDLYVGKQNILYCANQKDFSYILSVYEPAKKYSKFLENLNHVLENIPEGEFNVIFKNLYDFFKNVYKPKIFYDVIFLCDHYRKLHEKLNEFIIEYRHRDYIFQGFDREFFLKLKNLLLNEALPNYKTIECAISNLEISSHKLIDIIELLVKFDAKAMASTLNAAITGRRDDDNFEQIFRMLLRTGAMPTTETLNIACEDVSPEIIKELIQAGAIPTSETLNSAIKSKKKLNLLLGYGVVPTTETLNCAVSNSSKKIIQKILDLGVMPTRETLNIAKKKIANFRESRKMGFKSLSGSEETYKEIYIILKKYRENNKKVLKSTSKNDKKAFKISSKKS